MNCKHCSTNLPEGIYFCPSCGHLSVEAEFKNQELAKKYEQQMIAVVKGLKGQKHIDVAWNATADRFTRVMEQLQFILELPEFKQNAENLLNKLNAFFKDCRKPDFQIAFIGTVKAGKSTLINALLGRNLASTSVTPETAVLTKFRHSEGSDYVHVEFYNETEWAQLWSRIPDNAVVFREEYTTLKGEEKCRDWVGHAPIHKDVASEDLEKEIEQWTSSKKVEHYFVKEVVIGLHDFNMPREVVFVDTPGLDDPVKYRSDVTRTYLDSANAVIACVHAKKLEGHETALLARIFTNVGSAPEKVYVVGTQWDTLNIPVQENWKAQKEEWVKHLSQGGCYGNRDLARQNIIHVSAYTKNLVRDYDLLTEDDRYNLISIAQKFKIRENELEQKLNDLEDLSNIENINHKVDEIVAKFKEYKIKGIETSYLALQNAIRKHFAEIKTDQEEVLQAAKEDIKTIRAKYEEAQKERDELQDYRKQLNDNLKKVGEDTTKRIEKLSQELSGLVK